MAEKGRKQKLRSFMCREIFMMCYKSLNKEARRVFHVELLETEAYYRELLKSTGSGCG